MEQGRTVSVVGLELNTKTHVLNKLVLNIEVDIKTTHGGLIRIKKDTPRTSFVVKCIDKGSVQSIQNEMYCCQTPLQPLYHLKITKRHCNNNVITVSKLPNSSKCYCFAVWSLRELVGALMLHRCLSGGKEGEPAEHWVILYV